MTRILYALLLGLLLGACQSSGLQVSSGGKLRGDGAADPLNAKLKLPPGDGPFPAVVLLHGCGGWYGGNIDDWANWYVERGWVALAVDSFGTRGISQICDGIETLGTTQRALDAYGAADYLAQLASVDPARIVVMGFSHGGSTVTRAMSSDLVRNFRTRSQTRFQAGVGLYPGSCTLSKPYAPVLLIGAELDNWTPVSTCEWQLSASGFPNPTVWFHVIKGAYHSFDSFSWKGQPVGSRRYGQGYRLEPNAVATEQARRLVADFLQLASP